MKGFAAGAVAAAMPEAFAKAVRLRHDPDLTVLIADCHINGRPGVFKHYQPDELAKTIAEILRLDPLPARVELRQRDFWFPIKDSPEPGADREMWRLNMAENKGATCTFTLPQLKG